MYDSVDDFFVLHGKKPTFSESKPKHYLTNTQKTIRPMSGKEVVPYDADKYKDTIDSIRRSESLTFKPYDSCDREIQDFLTSSYDLRRSYSPSPGTVRSPKSFRDYEWYTNPPNLDTKIKEMDYKTAFSASSPDWEIANMGRKYFPVTLTDSFILKDDIESRPPKSLSPDGKGLPQPGDPWRPFDKTAYKKKRSRSPTANFKSFQPATRSLSDIDKMYTLEQEAPVMGRAAVHSSTPYQFDLAQLRLHRLRIEEEQLLEVKRVQELENTRGPQPKWYELKTPDFHYEARKNNQLLHSQNHWQDLVDYRDDLIRASNEFHRTYSAA